MNKEPFYYYYMYNALQIYYNLQLYGTVQKFDNDDDYYYYYYIPNVPTSGDLHIFTLKHYLIATS